MGNMFTHKTEKQIRKKQSKQDISSSVTSSMKTFHISDSSSNQLNDSVSDKENLPFQIFCYKQSIKNGDRKSARLYQSKLALTEGIIRTYNSFDLDGSLMEIDEQISANTLQVQATSEDNQKLSEYRKKLITRLKEFEKSKLRKKKDKKRLLEKFGKSARSSVKILVGKRKNIATK